MVTKKSKASLIRELQKSVQKYETAADKNRKYTELYHSSNSKSLDARRKIEEVLGELIGLSSELLQQYVWVVNLGRAWERDRYLAYVQLSAPVKRKNDPIDALLRVVKPDIGPMYCLGIHGTAVAIDKGVRIGRRPGHGNGYWHINFMRGSSGSIFKQKGDITIDKFVEKHQLKTQLSPMLTKEREHYVKLVASIDELKALRKKKKK